MVEEQDDNGKVWRFRKPSGEGISPIPVAEPAASAMRHDVPPWLHEHAPAPTRRVQWLSPSSAFDEESDRAFARLESSIVERRKALRRGRLLHRLMQSVPDVPEAGTQGTSIERYLKNARGSFFIWPNKRRWRSKCSLFSTIPNFADVFAPGSRAEVPIVGRIALTAQHRSAYRAKCDRLAGARGDFVLIADYKTDRTVPRQAQ